MASRITAGFSTSGSAFLLGIRVLQLPHVWVFPIGYCNNDSRGCSGLRHSVHSVNGSRDEVPFSLDLTSSTRDKTYRHVLLFIRLSCRAHLLVFVGCVFSGISDGNFSDSLVSGGVGGTFSVYEVWRFE